MFWHYTEVYIFQRTYQFMATYSLRKVQSVQHFPVFYGWMVWAVSTIGLISSAPAQGFTISLFYDHFVADFGLSRTTVSTLLGIGTFLGALSLTWVGKKIDQHGSHRVGAVVSLGYALVLMALSVLITGPITLFFAFFALRAMGQGGMVLVSNTAITKWWEERRGWVMSLTLVLMALSEAFYLRMLQSLIDTYGWRTTWLILGVAVAVTIVPLWWWLMRDRPEDFDMKPDGGFIPHVDPAESATTVPVDGRALVTGWTLKEARGTTIFWAFLVGRFFSVMFGSALIIHQVSIFAQVNHSALIVANVFGTMAVLRMGLSLWLGRIISRVNPVYVMATQLFAMMIVLLMSTIMRSNLLLIPFGVAFAVVIAIGGVFDGTVWADLFGRKYYGEIRGFVYTVLVTGTSVGPIIFGVCFDAFGTYVPVQLGGALILILPLMMSLMVKRPQRQSSAPIPATV